MTPEERKAWLSSLKPGDSVMVCDAFSDSRRPLALRRVFSVTKSGRVRINRHSGRDESLVEYDSDGRVRGEKSECWHDNFWSYTCLFPATEENKATLRKLLEEQKLDDWRRGIRQRLVTGIERAAVETLTDDQLRAIEAILNS